MEDYDWGMWYLQHQDDHQQPYDHGSAVVDQQSSLDESDLFNVLHGFDPISQLLPFEPQHHHEYYYYPMSTPTMTDDIMTYAECLNIANFPELIDPIISPSLHDSHHQQNYQILGVEDFNDFETWWNANLSILLYSDISSNADLDTTILPLHTAMATTSCSSSSTSDEVAASASAILTSSSSGNFNHVMEERGGIFFTDNDDDEVAVIRKKRRLKSSRPKSSNLDYEEIQKYFHVPIAEAAKELRVGVTVLKKRCRELAIARWPHRKIKSLNGLIHNVKELGAIANEEEIKMLEEHKRALEMVPGLELSSRTKKLRQACFKANFKKRRLAPDVH